MWCRSFIKSIKSEVCIVTLESYIIASATDHPILTTLKVLWRQLQHNTDAQASLLHVEHTNSLGRKWRPDVGNQYHILQKGRFFFTKIASITACNGKEVIFVPLNFR